MNVICFLKQSSSKISISNAILKLKKQKKKKGLTFFFFLFILNWIADFSLRRNACANRLKWKLRKSFRRSRNQSTAFFIKGVKKMRKTVACQFKKKIQNKIYQSYDIMVCQTISLCCSETIWMDPSRPLWIKWIGKQRNWRLTDLFLSFFLSLV